MNDNIGSNLKSLAKTLGVILLVLCIILAIIIWYVTESFTLGLISVASGFALYLSCWLLYGFGHLIEKVNDIESKLGHLYVDQASTKKTNSSSFDDLPVL